MTPTVRFFWITSILWLLVAFYTVWVATNGALSPVALAQHPGQVAFFGCALGPAELTARDALHIATRGGAQVLGRAHDVGHIAQGMCADVVLWDLRTLGFAGGAVHDPVASLLLCASPQAAWTVVNGRVVVRDGQLATVDLGPLLERHNRLALKLAAPHGNH
jgi:cytosine/adenosine deaminase-related metal-dependent hydrolase